LAKGTPNLAAHIKNALGFGVPVVVAVNRFASDSRAEIDLVRRAAVEAGAEDAVMADHWAEGGAGAVELAEAVIAACAKPGNFKFLYPLEWSIKRKIETIATRIYGADGVDYAPEAEEMIETYTRLGLDELPICMAKTHLSLSHNPAWKGVPKNFRVPVRDVKASVGAGFLYPLCGDMRTMPGLPTRPAFIDVDLDLKTGKVVGLL
jgi:formyltetrahydrofolate synthetase